MKTKKLKLRRWQKEALDTFIGYDKPDFLAVATPGAGKTTFALTAARLLLPNLPGQLVIVVPTKHLKEQWASAAAGFGFHIETRWQAGEKLPNDIHGIAVTYQQAGMMPDALFQIAQGGFTIFDEIHHAGEDRSWGDGIKAGFSAASRRLALSGTPFRSDTQAIPFVCYQQDQAVSQYEYGYEEALADTQVVREVYFPRFGGKMEWTSADGSELEASFDDDLSKNLANQRLRAALSMQGEWLPEVLSQANQTLFEMRKYQKNAAGLVIATDQDHAREIAKYLKSELGVSTEISVSEDPNASDKILKFTDSKSPWIVAVRMISEGVDIPRLRVGVYATATTTELFFRQAVGRIVRHQGHKGSQPAYMFIPDDWRLRKFGSEIAKSRKHNLTKKQNNDFDKPEISVPSPEDQMSLFQVHSATASPVSSELDVFQAINESENLNGSQMIVEDNEQLDLVIDLDSLPSLGGVPQTHSITDIDLRAERKRLRRSGQNLVNQLVDLSGKSHPFVNAELNRRAGINTITEASLRQLNKRYREAEKWLTQLQKRVRS